MTSPDVTREEVTGLTTDRIAMNPPNPTNLQRTGGWRVYIAGLCYRPPADVVWYIQVNGNQAPE